MTDVRLYHSFEGPTNSLLSCSPPLHCKSVSYSPTMANILPYGDMEGDHSAVLRLWNSR